MKDPRFASPNPVHRNTRRAFFHDYTRPGRYMITITRAQALPPFAILDIHNRLLSLTPLGSAIREELSRLQEKEPAIMVRESVIMPDHIHILTEVRAALPKKLGSYIGAYKGACSRRWWLLDDRERGKPLFIRGFNDRIIWDEEHLEKAAAYISENPARAAVKAANPDLFRRYNHLVTGDREFAAYGNVFLLRDFDRRPVIIHRADSAAAMAAKQKEWFACAANGGVLISPFISPAEKAVRDRAIELGGRLVILRNEGFEERFKPQGREFDLCSEGRLLLLAPWPDKLTRSTVTRAQALSMNALAVYLSSYQGPISLRR
ncbi:MAG: hypothetical protein K2O33_02715 [Muribaculaceae bacterium]|nr:hypothetical protein [Muribaculaceae bacterium]